MKENLLEILNKKKIPKNEEIENKIKDFKNYFNNFFRKFSPNKIYELNKIPDIELITSTLIVSNPLKTTQTLELINAYTKLFKDSSCKELLLILSLYTKNENFKTEINNTLNSKISNIQRNITLTKLFTKEGLNLQTLTHFCKFIKTNIKNIEKIKNTFDSFLPISEKECLSLIAAKNEFNYFFDTAEFKTLANCLNNNDRKYLKKSIIPEEEESKNLIKTALLFSEYINNKYIEIIKNYEQAEKERRRHNKNIEELIENLNTTLEITNINQILKLCPDTESMDLVLNYIIIHNKQIYQELLNNYKKLLVNTDENLNTLFRKYNYNYETLKPTEKEKLKENDYEEIENLLKRLTTLSITDINITKINKDKLTTIEELITKGLISKNWLNQNQSLLYDIDNTLDLITYNINLLSSKGINMIYYENSLNILKNDSLQNNLNILDTYFLIISKTTTNINFLNVSDLKERIDFIISIGLYQEIESLDILNYSLTECYKLKIANTLNITIDTIDIEEKDILSDINNKLIPFEVINKLNNKSNNTIDLPYILETYRIDKVTLDINGVLVSTEKIKRNLAKLETTDNISCFYAIIYNAHYNYEEIETLSETILNDNILYTLTKEKTLF